MNTTFEERLLAELKREVVLRAAEAPAPRRVVTSRRVGLALAACGAAAAVVVALPGSGTTPAYAVEKNADGTVTLTLNDLNISRAEQRNLVRALEKAGVHTQVTELPGTTRCAEPRGEQTGPHIITFNGPEKEGQVRAHPWSQTLHRGDTVTIDNPAGNLSWYGFYRGKAGPCEPMPKAG
ncbi:hypothetical protein [Streptomyces tailanensis]|uniref:hypothetical protein n=1 Tax=Streptomyces tailanensis TaxID=2569858 RepID=UPI00122DC611|nr:hypothetical protein [Streptomyces tailanensis]